MLLNQNCTQWSTQEYFHENMNAMDFSSIPTDGAELGNF